jgi:fructokinase
MGETIFDILFEDNRPFKGVPGGAAFNTMISLGRLGLKPIFLSELARDHVGDLLLRFMTDNGVATDHIYRYYGGQSPLSLAFLDANREAHYDFYFNYPAERLDVVWPRIDPDDIFLFGSLFAVKPELRQAVTDLLRYAADRKAILFYDPNFRIESASQTLHVMPSVIENLEFADIVRGSITDFQNLYRESDPDRIYRNHIRFYCPFFICTDGANGVDLRTPLVTKHYAAPAVTAVSTIGAGDTFNAGLIYALYRKGILRDDLASLDEPTWDELITTALQFAAEVCQSDENYISKTFISQIEGKKFN